SGVSIPVWCSVGCIQTDLLETQQGAGIVLSNYSGDPQKQIDITVDAKKPITSVNSVEQGALKFSQDEKNKTVTFSLPLNVFDIITMK
ncbi:MAG TPA: hypothetical protein PKK91_01825, partial [bacterium]|nr:hypothetical protein [bacterium]